MKSPSVIRRTVGALLLALATPLPGGIAFAQNRAQEQPVDQDPPPILENARPVPPPAFFDADAELVHRGEIVVFGQDVHLRKNERCRTMIVIGGNALIEGAVTRDVVVLFGSTTNKGSIGGDLVTILGPAHLNGTVRGTFVNILGSPTLGPEAVVEREAVTVGGNLRLDPGALIKRGRQEFSLGHSFQWLGDWFRGGLLKARPLPPSLIWAWFVAAAFLVVYALMTMVFPRPLRACVNSLDEAPVAAFFVGLLTFILFLPALVLLAVTVVGVPLLMLSLVVAIFFGKVAIYQFTGLQLGRQLNLSALQLPLVALLLGAMVFHLLYTIPILGFLVWGIGIVWGVGAVLMAVFANLKRDARPATVPVVAAAGAAANSGSSVPPPLAGLAAAPTPGAADIIHFERAGFWIRVGATIIDLLLIGVLSAFVFAGLAFPILLVVYHVAMWTWKGTTIGGVVFGLKIVRIDGRPIDFAVALVRSLFSIISFVFLLVGFFWAGWDKEKQSWHDKIAGTVIVKVPAGISLL
ncbi:MAG: RDD family protein [Verrucomicrobia bacterium]|nr:RDD family protein [Verrucomicrobiota bacterium]